jgi:uncharacterized protein
MTEGGYVAARNEPQDTAGVRGSGVEDRLKRPGCISYLHMPAVDVLASAAFYREVFGWTIHEQKSGRVSFDDGTGTMSGAWMTDQAVSREPGFLPYIYVDDIRRTVEEIVGHGGEIVQATRAEGDLWVATFRDPAGNVLGVWQAQD